MVIARYSHHPGRQARRLLLQSLRSARCRHSRPYRPRPLHRQSPTAPARRRASTRRNLRRRRSSSSSSIHNHNHRNRNNHSSTNSSTNSNNHRSTNSSNHSSSILRRSRLPSAGTHPGLSIRPRCRNPCARAVTGPRPPPRLRPAALRPKLPRTGARHPRMGCGSLWRQASLSLLPCLRTTDPSCFAPRWTRC